MRKSTRIKAGKWVYLTKKQRMKKVRQTNKKQERGC